MPALIGRRETKRERERERQTDRERGEETERAIQGRREAGMVIGGRGGGKEGRESE